MLRIRRLHASTRLLRAPNNDKPLYWRAFSLISSCPTDQVDDVIIELDGGGKMTLNATGLEMSTPNPLVKHWAQSYDGNSPILDIGCAYGRNVQAAHDLLKDKLL